MSETDICKAILQDDGRTVGPTMRFLLTNHADRIIRVKETVVYGDKSVTIEMNLAPSLAGGEP